MKWKVLQLIILLFMSSIAFTQSLTNKEIIEIETTIHSFLTKQEKTSESDLKRDRLSEYIMCFLNVDSSGNIYDFHILADNTNKDSTFGYLSKISSLEFKRIKIENCKGKMIVIPLISIGRGKSPLYVNNIIDKRPIECMGITSEINNIITIAPFVYVAPFSSKQY